MHVKTLCLGALCLSDGTGYDIKKLFGSAFSHFHTASFGAIYPALRTLEAEGMVSCRVEPGEKHPDRKLFSVTDIGKRAFLDELTHTPPTEQFRSEFLVLMFFAHLLPTDRLADILDEMESRYQSELDYLNSIWKTPGHSAGIDFTIENGIAVYSAALAQLRGGREELLASHQLPPKQAAS